MSFTEAEAISSNVSSAVTVSLLKICLSQHFSGVGVGLPGVGSVEPSNKSSVSSDRDRPDFVDCSSLLLLLEARTSTAALFEWV